MGLWFVDSFDLQDTAHVGRKYKDPDNPHPELEFQSIGFSGGFDSVLKRTGHQSFRGVIQKWHGGAVLVKMGVAFHSSSVQTGSWIRQFGGNLFYELFYENSGLNSGLRAEGFWGTIAGPTPITIIDGWNYLEWSAALHIYSPGDDYIHHVRLNEEEIFFGNPQTDIVLVDTYTNIREALGNKDDFYVIKPNSNQQIHEDFIGPVRIVALRPIGNGVLNTWLKFPLGSAFSVAFSPANYRYVDDNFRDFNSVPDDGLTYLSSKPAGEEESYKMAQIDPTILGMYGFQWNPYGAIGNESGPTTPLPSSENIAEYRHIYYNPETTKILGTIFELPSSPDPVPNDSYAYRTQFQEWDLSTIESGHPNTGSYVNNSRFGFEIETGVLPTGRISQSYIEVVLPVEVDVPDIPDPDPAPVPTVLSFKFAKLWNILLSDGTVYLFTNHNMDLINPSDGLTYTPIAGLRMSALQRRTGLDPTNSETLGIVDTVSFNSLLAGKMRGSIVTEYLLDWQYPWAGALLSTTNRIREMSFDGAKWSAQLSSVDQSLLLPKGEVYGRTCRHVLGDSSCKVNLDVIKQFSIIALQPIVGKTRFRAAVSASEDVFGNARLDGYYAFGNIFWSNSDNEGIYSEVRSNSVVDPDQPTLQDFILQVPLPFDITAGDRFDLWPGCDKVLSTCRDKFQNEVDGDIDIGNLKNYGGFPTIPGKDGIFTPLSEAKHVLSFGDIFPDSILGIVGDILF